MTNLKIFRIVTFVFGFVPSALLCILAWLMIVQFIRNPAHTHILFLLWALGGFAGTLGFVMAIFRTGRNKQLTSFLLVWGIASISPFIFFTVAHPNIALLLYGTILGLGVWSLWVEIKTQLPSVPANPNVT